VRALTNKPAANATLYETLACEIIESPPLMECLPIVSDSFRLFSVMPLDLLLFVACRFGVLEPLTPTSGFLRLIGCTRAAVPLSNQAVLVCHARRDGYDDSPGAPDSPPATYPISPALG